jgi:hypothetical protein
MKKILLMTAAMVTMSGLFAKKVAIVVDMTGQTVGTAGVHVAGNFQGWSPNTSSLLPIPGKTGFYGNIFDINAGQVIEFKAINGDAWSGAEGVPAICQKGHPLNGQTNDNRWMYIDSMANDTSVINIKYSSSAPAGKYAVRLAVDLKNEASVSASGVHIAGSLQGWDPAKTMMANLYAGKLYEIIMTLDTGLHQYKFVNGNAWGKDESVPSTCAVSNNREIRVTADLVVNKVCFGSCVACPTAAIPTYPLRFQVDMNSSNCDGGFDSVTVAGAGAKLTAFGAGLKMSQVGTSGIYALTVNDLDSGEAKFKFRFHKNGNTNWEGGPDRILTLSKSDTVKLTCFGSRVEGPCPSKPATSKITFVVDFTATGAPTPASKIYIIGDFTKPQWQAGAVEMTQIAGKPGIYSVTFDSICPGKINYKFTNGDATIKTNEEDYDSLNRSCVESNGIGGFNRVYVRTVASPVKVSYQFNKCVAGYTSVSEAAFASQVTLYPNPTNDYSVLAFNDRSNSHNVTILDLAGKTIRTYNNYELATLKIERNELKAGIYFVNVVNSDNQSATMKLMIQE